MILKSAAPAQPRTFLGATSLEGCVGSGASGEMKVGRAPVERVDDDPRHSPAPSGAVDPLDPMTRSLFSQGLVPHVGAAQPPLAALGEDAVARASRTSLEHMMSRFVRRVAWSGDAHSGSARLEFGAGALEGATLTIHSDAGVLRICLDLPPGVDPLEWRRRISERLGARRLQVAELEVG